MADYEKPVMHGVTASGDKKPILLGNDGGLGLSVEGEISVDFGTKIDATTMPSGGAGNLGWLSAIWKLISDRIPVLVDGKIPVSTSGGGGGGDASAANQVIGNTSLANIDTKTPALGQALATASVPVVLPAAQITTLTPPTSVGISGTLPAFANTPTFNIGTVPSLTFTNTSFTANAGTNLDTSTLALESGGNLASINTKLPSSLTVSATRLLVDGSQVTQPVSMATAPTGLAYVASTLVTRPANVTPYTANDVYGNVFELTSIGASGGFIFIESLDIIFNITAVPSGMSSFTLYLYSVTPPSAIADNLAFSVSSGDRASILTPRGIVLSASLAQGGGSVVAEIRNLNQLYKLTGTSLFGYVVTNGAFTPAANSESFTIRARSFAP